MRRNKRLLLSIIILLALAGCKDENTVENEGNNNNQNPDSPQLIEPVNNSVITAASVLVKWNSYPNAETYRVQLSLDANFIGSIPIDTVISGTELSIQSNLIATGVFYYWHVIANLQGGGSSNWSAVWRFSMILPPPPPPILLLPANGSVNQPFLPFFDWEDAPTAQFYRLQISENPNFTVITFDSSAVRVSELQSPPYLLTTNTLYYWRVSASNSNGLSTSDWSQAFSFTTVNGPEPNSISGTITFADTTFIHFPSYYSAEAYKINLWPPFNFASEKGDSLVIKKINNVYQASYKLRNLRDSAYYVTVTAHNDVGSASLVILGVYGCDTARVVYSPCALNPNVVRIINYNGIENINILSWADSSKNIFRKR